MIPLKRNLFVRNLFVALVVVCATVFVSCEQGTDTSKPEPPPPPSPEETRQAAQQLIASSQTVNAGESLEQFSQRIMGEISQFKMRHTTSTGAQETVKITRSWLDRMQGLMDEQKWEPAMVVCNWVLAMDPTNSRASRARNKIQKELNKPKLHLVGFYRDREQQRRIVIFEVEDPQTGQKERVDAEVGDEFFGYQLKRVIGENQGAVVEYLETHTRQTIMLEKD